MLREVTPLPHIDIAVVDGLDDQAGNADVWEHVPHVDIGVDPEQLGRSSRRRTAAEHGREPPRGFFVAREARRVIREIFFSEETPTVMLELAGVRKSLLRVGCPRVVRRAEPLRESAIGDQGAGALWVRRSEDDAHAGALRMSEERSALAARRIHDRADVVHALFDGRVSGDAIGEAGAALVEHDDARERAESLEAVRHARVLPEHLDVRDPPWHVHEIERSAAEDLVGDAHVGAVRVARLGRHGRLL